LLRQRNFTDPDSRVLLTKDGFIQGYNAQAAVDGAKQMVLLQTSLLTEFRYDWVGNDWAGIGMGLGNCFKGRQFTAEVILWAVRW
jgi:hypothetical protein